MLFFKNSVKWAFAPIILILVSSLLFTLWSCTKSSQSLEKLTIAEASTAIFALLYIADEEGYFKDERLEVNYNTFTSGKDALNSAIKGESDIATVYETPVVLKTYEGVDLSVISTLHYSNMNTGIVVKKDRGIETPEDLVGKKIGVTKNTNGEFFLQLFLTNHGIDIAQVTSVDTKPYDMVEALKSGEVDAIATWNPHIHNAKKTFKEKEIDIFYSDIYREISMLVGRREVVSEKHEAMKRLLKAILKAESFLNANPEKALDIVVKRLSDQSEETIRGVWPAFTVKATLSNVLLTTLEQEAEWFKNEGRFSTPAPDFNKVIFVDYLEQLKPEAVTIR